MTGVRPILPPRRDDWKPYPPIVPTDATARFVATMDPADVVRALSALRVLGGNETLRRALERFGTEK